MDEPSSRQDIFDFLVQLHFESDIHIFNMSSFRDRRYEYKGLNKVWKGKLSEAKASGNSIKIQEAQVWKLFLIS